MRRVLAGSVLLVILGTFAASPANASASVIPADGNGHVTRVRGLPTRGPELDASPDFVRTCETGVYGRLSRGWREHSLGFGRLWLVYLKENGPPPSGWSDAVGGYRQLKVLVVVRRGPAVTLSVAPTDEAGLIYDPALFNDHDITVAEADASVRFKPCRSGARDLPRAARRTTQFNGGLVVVDGGTCASFTAAWIDHDPVTRQISLASLDACT